MRATSVRTWVVLGAALVLGACDFVTVDPTLLYLKEADGGCAVEGQYPWSDGFCHFGPEGLADAGPRDGGGTGGNGDATDGGGTDAGRADAGPVDAGCMPTTCAANGWNCGSVDAGCGVQLSCGACDPARFEACGVGGVPNVCAPAEICSDDGWCWQNPLPQGNTLRAVWVNGPNDVWTGGDHGTLLHWDGEKWSRLAIPPPYSTIRGIASFGSNLWVLADTRILRWDGSTWQSETTGTTIWTAIGGTSATNLFAVNGSALSSRLSGGTWTDNVLPASLDAGSSLWVEGPGAVLVGGMGGVFRFSGGLFSQTAEITGQVDAIAGIPSGPAFAVIHPTSIDTRIVRRNDAGIWTQELSFVYPTLDAGLMVTPNLPWSIRGFSVDPAAGVWAFGDDGVQARLDGGQWVEVRPPTGIDAGGGIVEHQNLYAAHAGGGDVWAVGELGTTWRLDGGSLRPVSAGRTVDLSAVSAASPSQVWAVGGDQTTLQVGRPAWTERAQCTGHMRSVWADPNGDVYFLSDTQGCLRTSTGTMTSFKPTPPPTWGYHVVVGPSPMYVVANDFTGSEIHRGTAQGSGWVSVGMWWQSEPISSAWRAPNRSETWFVSATTLYGVQGDTSAPSFDANTSGQARGVFGVDRPGGGHDVFVVEDGGVVSRRIGASYMSPLVTVVTDSLIAGAGDGVSHGWIVGSRGTLVELTSSSLVTPRESGTDHELRGVASLPDGGVWAVGVGGTILHHK